MRWVAVFLLAGCGSSNVPFEAGDLTVNAPRAPSAVIAFRDGDHAWVVASGAESPLVFRVSTGEYTVAIGCSDTSVGRVAHADVYEMTLADLASLTYDRNCDMSSAQVALTGNVAGIDPNSDGGYQVAWGDVFQNTNGQQYGFTTHVGTRDLVATRGSVATDRLLIIRDFVVASNTVQSVDFGSPDAISLVPRTLERAMPPSRVKWIHSEMRWCTSTRGAESMFRTASSARSPGA